MCNQEEFLVAPVSDQFKSTCLIDTLNYLSGIGYETVSMSERADGYFVIDFCGESKAVFDNNGSLVSVY